MAPSLCVFHMSKSLLLLQHLLELGYFVKTFGWFCLQVTLLKKDKNLGRDARNASPCLLIDGWRPSLPLSYKWIPPPHELVISVNDPENTLKVFSSHSLCRDYFLQIQDKAS